MVLEVADLLASIHIEDLRRAVATSRNKATVVAETHAAHDTLMCQVVNKLHIKSAVYAWVEHGMPILSLALKVGRQLLRLEFTKLVADLLQLCMRVLKIRSDLLVLILEGWWCRPGDVRRAWVRVRLALLWRGRTGKARGSHPWLPWAWRGSRLWWLGTVACEPCQCRRSCRLCSWVSLPHRVMAVFRRVLT